MTGVEIKKTCSICLEEGEEVKQYCKCNKEMGLYHKECLTHWVEESGKYICSFCKTHYDLEPDYNMIGYEILDAAVFIIAERRVYRARIYTQIVFLVIMVVLIGGLLLGNAEKHTIEWANRQCILFICIIWFVGFWILKLLKTLPPL